MSWIDPCLPQVECCETMGSQVLPNLSFTACGASRSIRATGHSPGPQQESSPFSSLLTLAFSQITGAAGDPHAEKKKGALNLSGEIIHLVEELGVAAGHFELLSAVGKLKT